METAVNIRHVGFLKNDLNNFQVINFMFSLDLSVHIDCIYIVTEDFLLAKFSFLTFFLLCHNFSILFAISQLSCQRKYKLINKSKSPSVTM